MPNEENRKTDRQTRVLIIILGAVTILLVIALTMAWLFQNKGLQTMTKIQFQSLDLVGKDTATVSVELGEIDVREAGEKRIPFSVVASEGTEFVLQLGYTTNLPLNYTIIDAGDDWTNWDTVGASSSNIVSGKYINLDESNKIANQDKHETTYGTYGQSYVQKNAEPVYWQSDRIERTAESHNYVLIVNWTTHDNTDVVDKDTDMIYLTAGIPGDNNNETEAE